MKGRDVYRSRTAAEAAGGWAQVLLHESEEPSRQVRRQAERLLKKANGTRQKRDGRKKGRS